MHGLAPDTNVTSLVQAGMEQRCMLALTLVVPNSDVRVLAPHAPRTVSTSAGSLSR